MTNYYKRILYKPTSYCTCRWQDTTHQVFPDCDINSPWLDIWFHFFFIFAMVHYKIYYCSFILIILIWIICCLIGQKLSLVIAKCLDFITIICTAITKTFISILQVLYFIWSHIKQKNETVLNAFSPYEPLIVVYHIARISMCMFIYHSWCVIYKGRV